MVINQSINQSISYLCLGDEGGEDDAAGGVVEEYLEDRHGSGFTAFTLTSEVV